MKKRNGKNLLIFHLSRLNYFNSETLICTANLIDSLRKAGNISSELITSNISAFFILLILMSLTREISSCICSNEILLPITVASYLISCKGTCSAEFFYSVYVKREYPAGNQFDINECHECECLEPETFVEKYPLGSNIVGYYNCSSSCKSAKCYLKSKTTFQGISGLVATYRCMLCHEDCSSCLNSLSCTSCDEVNGYYLQPDLSRKNCSTVFGIHCLSCNLATCTLCESFSALDLTSKIFIDTGSPPYQCILCSTINLCRECTDGIKCTVCDSLLYLNFASGKKIVNLGNRSCLGCTVFNCLLCTDGPRCLKCHNSYYLDFVSCNICLNEPTHLAFYASSQTVISVRMGLNAQFVASITILILVRVIFCIIVVNKTCVYCPIQHCQTCIDGPKCFACQSLYYIDFSSGNQSCVTCTIPNCVSCIDGPFCSSCEYGSILSGVDCVACSDALSNCLNCISLLACLLCEYPYALGASGKCDECVEGFEYNGNICIKPVGCGSPLPDFSKCLACSKEYNFVYEPINSSCICVEGYTLKKILKKTICQFVGGNGIKTSPDEDCDDGNIRDNDGCDRNCKKEFVFSCTSETPSKCNLDYTSQSFSYNYAYKYEGENKAKFSFSLRPKHSVFQYVQWKDYISLNASENFMVKSTYACSYSLKSNEIQIEFEYIQNLEGLYIEAKLFINDSDSVVTSSSEIVKMTAKVEAGPKINSDKLGSSIIFQIQGMNTAVLYEEDSIMNAYQTATFISIGVQERNSFLELVITK